MGPSFPLLTSVPFGSVTLEKSPHYPLVLAWQSKGWSCQLGGSQGGPAQPGRGTGALVLCRGAQLAEGSTAGLSSAPHQPEGWPAPAPCLTPLEVGESRAPDASPRPSLRPVVNYLTQLSLKSRYYISAHLQKRFQILKVQVVTQGRKLLPFGLFSCLLFSSFNT